MGRGAAARQVGCDAVCVCRATAGRPPTLADAAVACRRRRRAQSRQRADGSSAGHGLAGHAAGRDSRHTVTRQLPAAASHRHGSPPPLGPAVIALQEHARTLGQRTRTERNRRIRQRIKTALRGRTPTLSTSRPSDSPFTHAVCWRRAALLNVSESAPTQTLVQAHG